MGPLVPAVGRISRQNRGAGLPRLPGLRRVLYNSDANADNVYDNNNNNNIITNNNSNT